MRVREMRGTLSRGERFCRAWTMLDEWVGGITRRKRFLPKARSALASHFIDDSIAVRLVETTHLGFRFFAEDV